MSIPISEQITDLPTIVEDLLIRASELSSQGDHDAVDELLAQVAQLRNPDRKV